MGLSLISKGSIVVLWTIFLREKSLLTKSIYVYVNSGSTGKEAGGDSSQESGSTLGFVIFTLDSCYEKESPSGTLLNRDY